MAQSCVKVARTNNLKNLVNRRVLILRRFTRILLNRIVPCTPGKSQSYLLLSRAATPSPSVSRSLPPPVVDSDVARRTSVHDHDSSNRRSDSDLVSLKISLLGDPDTGKTCFLAKYVGGEKQVEMRELEKGIHCTDKTLSMGGARISYSICELQGAEKSRDLIPTACKDSVAILFMFDLTSRCTLNNVISWYQQARKSNQTAIPVMVGTKFDEFIQLPIDLQWTIASQARTYAKALNATLFFSSASYNINVNKIFKFVTAKLFDLPWTVERNLTVGEPIIDY
ncbi:Ras-related small GTP-binding family protein [Raphanus sativus]|uniref:Septum-promoting GTP-binding protein 1-like n=1 Tax=Raphanus sativus TaxID=3726 RepID=A0A6J0NUK1_RAPSA|nr:septum-promoting GTP-binding protein 1-like [Raphanus sativus]KAJ4897580.1 Ras-related small GTP-binding family protein [Raphanus sativus]